MTTKIEWCDETWNPITGCSPISEGCQNCYAARMAKRLAGRCGYPKDDPFNVTFHPEKMDEPIKLKKSKRIFVGSMTDIFHESVNESWLFSLFHTISRHCKSSELRKLLDIPNHQFLILTKRPDRMRFFFNTYKFPSGETLSKVVLDNLWLGVTVENEKYLWRVEELSKIPAAVRFVSVEPMLSEINLHLKNTREDIVWRRTHGGSYVRQYVDWVICGGETGPGARPMHPDWVRSLRDQCVASDVPLFFKGWWDWAPVAPCYDQTETEADREADQIAKREIITTSGSIWDVDHDFQPPPGAWFVERVGKKRSGRLLDGKEWNQFPKTT